MSADPSGSTSPAPLDVRAFPRTHAALTDWNPARTDEVIQHLLRLEAGFGQPPPLADRSDPTAQPLSPHLFDVVLAGGGLSLIYAAVWARAGLRVCVLDRGRIGSGHREWNISRSELAPLVSSGLYTPQEVDSLISLQYDAGLCRFGTGPSHPVHGVLDCVIDSEALLTGLVAKAERAGAVLLHHHAITGYQVQPTHVQVTCQVPGQPAVALSGRLLVDALGVQSPHAAFDLCCPTVGGVMDGLPVGTGDLDLNPRVGEILVTTEGVLHGEQHIWEGFPAPAPNTADVSTGRMTIYLFYYQRAARIQARIRAGQHPLFELFERFFERLPVYKRGALRLHKPTYGFIPGYSRLGAMPSAPGDRVLLVGDAAARQSPLTYCGFGSTIRSFWPLAQAVIALLAHDTLTQQRLSQLWREPPALQVMGGLALMMTPPVPRADRPIADPDAINSLLAAAFSSLAALGDETYARFLRDDVDAATFVRFMLATADKHPQVYRQALKQLSIRESMTWLRRLWTFRRQSQASFEIAP